jgi:hypothetical protein
MHDVKGRYVIRGLVAMGIAALATLAAAQVWHGRTTTPFLHLQYVTHDVDNDNLDKIDDAIRKAYAVLPTTTTVTTSTTTTTT